MERVTTEFPVYKDENDKPILNRREKDKPVVVKIRDYTLPILAFKAEFNGGRFGPYDFYYVARGDGTIVATYTDSQAEWEKVIEL